MGSCCAFIPGSPLLLASISKGGSCAIHDLRMLGGAQLSVQLQGPVYDATWISATPAALAAAAQGVAAGSSNNTSSSGDRQLWLVAAGLDAQLRCYAFTAAALQTGVRRRRCGMPLLARGRHTVRWCVVHPFPLVLHLTHA